MNEYLENLKNTQGKTKTPPRLTNILPKLGFNMMRDSPDIPYKQSLSPPESVNNADDVKCEKKIARDFMKYGAFHKVDKGHNLNDSQESLSDLSDSEDESSDKLVISIQMYYTQHPNGLFVSINFINKLGASIRKK